MLRTLHRFGIALVYLFLYLPIAIVIAFSFNEKSFPSPWEHFSLKWYYQLFQERPLWSAFCNSLFIALVSTAISLTLGALLIFFRCCGGRIAKSVPLFYGNLVVPETVLAISLLSYFSFFHVPLGLPTLVVAHTVLGLGFVIPILHARYLQLNTRLDEASLVLGATNKQTFFKITLPLLRPTMIATGLLIFILSFDDFVLAYFCAGTTFQTLSLYLLAMLRTGVSPVMNALGSVLLLLSSLLVLIFFSKKVRSRIV